MAVAVLAELGAEVMPLRHGPSPISVPCSIARRVTTRLFDINDRDALTHHVGSEIVRTSRPRFWFGSHTKVQSKLLLPTCSGSLLC